jgi:hypothetical protein
MAELKLGPPKHERFQFRTAPKASARKNLAGALHRDEIGCTFSPGRKFKTEIPGDHAAD